MVLAFNKDVFGLPIAIADSQRALSRLMNINHNMISRQIKSNKRNKRSDLKFIEFKEEKQKRPRIQRKVCYAVYDCNVKGEPIIQLFDTIKETSAFLDCWDSSTKNLIDKDVKNRQGYKVAKIILEDE